MGDFLGGIGKGLSNLGKAVGNETKRIGDEAGRHMTESINDISKGVKDGGFVGGLATAADKLSPGNFVAGAVDSIIPGEDLPQPLVDGISAAVNFGVGGPFAVMGLIDGFQAISGLMGSSSAAPATGAGPAKGAAPTPTTAAPTAPTTTERGQRMQTPESPQAARERVVHRHHQAIELRGYAVQEAERGRSSLGGGSVTRTGDKVIVMGTAGADRIDVEKQRDGSVKLTVNGQSTTLTAEEAKNLVIVARAGSDVVNVGNGLDDVRVFAGSGDDRVVIEGDDAYVVAGRGNDSVTVTGDDATVIGGAGRDRVRVTGDDARVSGGAGRDVISVRGDDARVSGGAGRDRINVRGDDATVRGGAGRDRINVRGDDANVRGGRGRDDVRVTDGPQLVYRGGPDYLRDIGRVRDGRIDAGFAPGVGSGTGVDGSSGVDGGADVDVGADFGGFIGNAFIKDEIRGGKSKDPKMAKLERDLAEATADIERILNDPNLSFEDMIFLLMRAVIKQSEAEVKMSLQEEKLGREEDKKLRDAGQAGVDTLKGDLNTLNGKIAAATDPKEKEKLQVEAGTLRTKIDTESTRLQSSLGDSTDSRSERFEELKESLQKVSEMQQALSNIMNTLHQTAMNAIGNIR